MSVKRPDGRLDEIEAVYRGAYPRFLRVAMAIIGDEGLATDAVQDGFVRAVSSIHLDRHSQHAV